MSGRIPEHFIDELLGRVDIVAVVNRFVPLKKQGKDFMACCPFHNEKTPSFSVSPDKQFYYCFGCGAHGSAIGFLMDYAHMDFVEAVEDLAAQAGLAVPREGGAAPERAQAHAPLFDLMGAATRFYRRQLREHPQAPRAVEYLKRRGLTGEVAKTFQLGYAPPGWDSLLKALGSDARARELIAQAGLSITRDSGAAYDRFRDRIIFPIQDRRGRVVGFGGRALDDATPKYLNSPETALFHKGRELYGLYLARKTSRNLARILVVEGYMDVVALAQHGIGYAVATLGTATTAEHLERLYGTVPEVVFCFDGDAAGRQAAWRALETALPLMREGRQARFMFLPEHHDPDSLVREAGREDFEARIARAVPLSAFLLSHLSAQVEIDTPEGKQRLETLAQPLIAKLPEGTFRQLVGREVERITGARPAELAPVVRRPIERGPPQPGASQGEPDSLVRRLVTMLLQRPALASLAHPESVRGLALPGVELLVELLELLRRNPNLPFSAILEHFRGRAEERHLAKLAQRECLLEQALESEFGDALRRLEVIKDDQRFELLQRKVRTGSLSAEEKREYARLAARSGEL